MKKLSVSEYASTFNVSVQSVYQKIKRGSKQFEITTNSPVMGYLDKHYTGNRLSGLTDQSKGRTADIIKDDLIEEARKMIL